jgi:tetratricopeptide (TPR) repeat protein
MLRYLARVVWRRRWITLLLLLFLLLLGTGIAIPCYALHQWHTAQSDVKAGRYAEARGRLNVCLFVWPNSPSVHLLAARVAWQSGELSEAEAHLQRCLQLQKGESDAVQLEYLLMRVRQGEVDEVAPTLMTCVENQHPETPLILETLSAAYMHDHRYGPAYATLSRWIQETPDAPLPYYWRGWVEERLNDADGAMKEYQQALLLAPDMPAYRLKVAEMYLEKHNPPEAAPHLELLSRQHPDRADIMARLGQCRFMQGQLDEARPLLETAVEKLPNDPALLMSLAKLRLQENQPAEAERWARRLLKVDPADHEALFTLHSSLQQQGRKEEAAVVLAQYEKVKAELVRANRLLRDETSHPTRDAATASEVGSIFLSIGQDRLGLYWLQQALERDPGHQPTHKLLAEYYESKGDRDKAAVHRRRLEKR